MLFVIPNKILLFLCHKIFSKLSLITFFRLKDESYLLEAVDYKVYCI